MSSLKQEMPEEMVAGIKDMWHHCERAHGLRSMHELELTINAGIKLCEEAIRRIKSGEIDKLIHSRGLVRQDEIERFTELMNAGKRMLKQVLIKKNASSN